MPHIEPLHAARLAMLEGALCALLREAHAGDEPYDWPNEIRVTLGPLGIDIEYMQDGRPVGGEGL